MGARHLYWILTGPSFAVIVGCDPPPQPPNPRVNTMKRVILPVLLGIGAFSCVHVLLAIR
jgi:hypothetical protein